MIIPVNLDEKYDVIVENGALDDVEKHLKLNRKVLVLTDDGVPETYAEKVAEKCETPVVVTLKHGEESKNFDNFKHILSVMLENSFSRKDCVVGACAACELNRYGTATDGKGKACKKSPSRTLVSEFLFL